MEIIALADIHGDLDYLPAIGEAVARADLVLIAGDITNFGGRREMRDVLLDLHRYTPHVFAVPGNCDGPAVNQYLIESKIDLHCRRVDFQDWTLLGLCSWLACPHTPQPADARDIVKGSIDWLATQYPSDRPVIFVSHQPPSDTAVDRNGDRHSGSPEIRDFIERYQPVLALSGHFHDSVGQDCLGKTTLVNPGAFRQGRYASILTHPDHCSVELRSV
jgi:uncharacterized protein